MVRIPALSCAFCNGTARSLTCLCPPPEELCLELARAIEAGDTHAASQHASSLARQKAVLTIQVSQKNYADGELR